MKRDREDDEQDASSDDEMGPMPVSDAQVVKKKRKGTSNAGDQPLLTLRL